MRNGWTELAAELLGCAPGAVAARAAAESFIAMGGTSLRAAELVALAERELGRSLDIAGLLGATPFAQVVTGAVAYQPVPVPDRPEGLRPLLPEQGNLLGMDRQIGGTANHLLFTAEADGELDEATLRATLLTLTRRHEALRTVFIRHRHAARRRVLPDRTPRLLIERVRPAAGVCAVTATQARIAGASAELLDPYAQPPVIFIWTQVCGGGHLLSLLVHHTVLDGWSAGLLWRELVEVYAAGGQHRQPTGRSPEVALARHRRLVSSGRMAELTRSRVAQLRGVVDVLELPSDLARPAEPDPRGARHLFGVGARARGAAEELAGDCRVTRTAVLLTAWGLVLARRAGVRDFLVAMATTGRPTADLQDAVAMCTRVVPVRLAVGGTVADCVRLTASRMAEAVAAADVPFGQLVMELGRARGFDSLPFPSFSFATHDDLVPRQLRAGPLTLTLHEGHCGGTVFDATLFVQRWDESARLAVEYKPSVLTLTQAAGLAEALEQTLIDMAGAATRPVAEVRAMSDRQRVTLDRLRRGPPGSTADGPWEIIAAHGRQLGATAAIRAADAELTYAQLPDVVAGHAGMLAAAGIRAGDRVVVAVPRSAAEIVAVLACLRQGAAYVAVDPDSPDLQLRYILDRTRPSAVIAATSAGTRLACDCALIAPWAPEDPAAADPVAAAPADPERVAYVSFTSGSTGRPKGVLVPNRGLVRLAHQADYLGVRPRDRFLRLAPLTFDGSALEIFAALLAGATLEVFPAGPVTPALLADFLTVRQVTVAFLTAGLFRLQVDHRPDAFASARHVMTGGDVVPAEQVRTLLSRYPGLRVSNLYGPTENAVVTTAFSVDDPCLAGEPVPIGVAIPETSVLVLDDERRPVPPGGVGELYTGGLGLALGYLDMPADTAAGFGHRAPDTGEPLYRTGDLVRWDDLGRLRFLGRGDNQVKISGFRVELDAIAARLREHPAVRDAVVAATAGDAAQRRLIAGVVAATDDGLVAELRQWVADALPAHAVPALWAVLDELPVTGNGKVDTRELESVAAKQSQPRSALSS